jgi:hypothetical protein
VVKTAKSWWAYFFGNASSNKTAVLHPPYAQLDSCHNTTLHPPPACPGPKNAIFGDWFTLKQRLSDSTRASAFDQYVFNDTTGATRQAFTAYLGHGAGPEFYDGTKSYVKLSDAGCGGKPGRTVAHEFELDNNANTCETAAITCRLDPAKPLRTFFEPRAISLNNQQVPYSNVATLFHEALHGFLQLDDPHLQTRLGCTQPVGSDTRDITIYIQQFVGAQPPPAPPLRCVDIENHMMPANPNVCVR